MLSCFSHVRLFAIPWTVACMAPLSMGILQARILEWVAMPSSRGSSRPGIEPISLVSPASAGRFFTISATWASISKYTHWRSGPQHMSYGKTQFGSPHVNTQPPAHNLIFNATESRKSTFSVGAGNGLPG